MHKHTNDLNKSMLQIIFFSAKKVGSYFGKKKKEEYMKGTKNCRDERESCADEILWGNNRAIPSEQMQTRRRKKNAHTPRIENTKHRTPKITI